MRSIKILGSFTFFAGGKPERSHVMAAHFFRLCDFRHVDERRSIVDFTFQEGVDIPFAIKQVKAIVLSQKAVDGRLSIGNHFHTTVSNRTEFFIASGKEDTPLFKVRTRDQGGEVVERGMTNGDACLIMPGVSHSFLPLVEGTQLWGFSNLPYDSKHDVSDKLFE
jgi:hypothetical protein